MKYIKNKWVYSKAEILLFFAFVVCAYPYFYMTLNRSARITYDVLLGVGLLGILISSYVYVKSQQKTIPRQHFAYLAYSTLIAISFIFFEQAVFRVTRMMLMLVSMMVWYLVATSSKPLSETFIKDIAIGVGRSIYNYVNGIRAFQRVPVETLTKEGEDFQVKKRKFVGIAFGLFLTIPLMLIVISVLGDANPQFANWIKNLPQIGGTTLYFIHILLLAAFLCYFLLLFVAFSGKSIKGDSLREKGEMKETSTIVLKMVMGGLSIVYIVYNVIAYQTMISLIASQSNVISWVSKTTVNGFSNIIMLSIVNLCIYSFVEVKGKGKLKALRVVLLVITMLLIVQTLTSMHVYVDTYGLSVKRVLSTIFMFLLLISSASFIVSMYKPYRAYRFNVALYAVVVLILLYSNLGGNIAAYNLQAYNKGDLVEFRVEDYQSVADEALPVVVDYYKMYPERVKYDVEYLNDFLLYTGGIQTISFGEGSGYNVQFVKSIFTNFQQQQNYEDREYLMEIIETAILEE